MKRYLNLLVVFLVCLLLVPAAPAWAGNQVIELNIDVALENDGSAEITQDFYTYTDEGTEFYMERLDSGYLEFTDFSVSDENGAYLILSEDEWDIDASFAEKANKAGMRSISGGKELCWGISEYGEHHYTVKYKIHNLVTAYNEEDGFNYRFIDPYQEVFPTNAKITIYRQDGTPLTDEECDIWAFGYDGQIQFENGKIIAWTESSLDGSAHMTIMVGFAKDLFAPVHIVADDFATVKDNAFLESDYDSELTKEEALALITLVCGMIAIFCGCLIGYPKNQKRKNDKIVNSTEYFRDIPNNGDLNVTKLLGCNLGFFEENGYLGARILRLITLGSLEPEYIGNAKDNLTMRLVREPHNGDAYDEAVYTFLQAAAGSDGILQANEMEIFCRKKDNAKALNKILDEANKDGKVTLVRQGCLKGSKCEKIKDLTPKGNEQLNEVLGLKRYLQDFSLIAERQVHETIIWQDYMVYAVLFGIAKEVMTQIKVLYPEQLEEIETYQRYILYSDRYNTAMYSAVEKERQAQYARSMGSGGRASFGGGGGFSGGGRVGTR